MSEKEISKKQQISNEEPLEKETTSKVEIEAESVDDVVSSSEPVEGIIDSNDSEKLVDEANKPKKSLNLKKGVGAVSGSAKKLIGAIKSLKKSKKADSTDNSENNQSTEKGKKPSKIGNAAVIAAEGIKNASKATANFSKQTCNRCYTFLKEKGVIEKAKNNKPLTLLFSSLFLIVVIALLILAFSGHHQKTGPSPVSNLMKINTIQAELGNIQNTVTTTSQMNEQEKQALEDKLQEIDAKLNEFSSNSGAPQNDQIKNLQATLQSNKVNLSQKISALNKEINRIKTKVFPAPTLSSKALPFKVVAVDPWNGEPYAEVTQRNNSTMTSYVGLYQTVGGWKVIDINAPEQTVTFINEQGQVVHVQVKQF